MEFSIFTWFGFKHPFGDIVKLIKEAGFHSAMIWWGDEGEKYAGSKYQQPDLVRKAGLKLDNAHLPFSMVNALWEDTPEGQEVYSMYCSHIDDCKTHEIPTAVMHALNGANPPPYTPLGLERFKRLTDRAERNGVTIALENARRPEYHDYVLKNIDSDRMKFCYDSGHENCFTPEVDYLARYGSRLAALHLHDNDGTRDQHLMPFNGNVNWKRIMTRLKELDYRGPLAFEIDAQFTDVSKDFTAPEYLNEAMSRIRKLTEM